MLLLNMTAHRRGRALKGRCELLETALVFLVFDSRFLRPSSTLPRSVQNYHIVVFPPPSTLLGWPRVESECVFFDPE
jgi:hypothetical protein